MDQHSRRAFLKTAGGGVAAPLLGGRSLLAAAQGGGLDAFIGGERRSLRIPGLAACLVKSGLVAWSKGYGWATELREGRGHDGSDPGIRTMMSFRPSDGVGAILFANRADVDLSGINRRLFDEAARI